MKAGFPTWGKCVLARSGRRSAMSRATCINVEQSIYMGAKVMANLNPLRFSLSPSPYSHTSCLHSQLSRMAKFFAFANPEPFFCEEILNCEDLDFLANFCLWYQADHEDQLCFIMYQLCYQLQTKTGFGGYCTI